MKDFKISIRFSNPTKNLSRYFSEVMKEDLLSPHEEFDLAVRAKQGDELAKEKIIKSNLRFVISVAKSYTGKSSQLEDLISEGNKGLIEAIESFDPTTGFKFISYAVWHIRKNILLYMQTKSRTIKIPINILCELKKYQEIENSFMNQYDREPSVDEILQLIDEKKLNPIGNRTIDIIKNNPISIPLESNNTEDEIDSSPINWIESDNQSDINIKEGDNKILVSEILLKLKENERKMIEMKYGLNGFTNMSYFQIADHFKKSNEWARLNLNKIERRLMAIARKKGIKTWA